jgi:hypothetical protein
LEGRSEEEERRSRSRRGVRSGRRAATTEAAKVARDAEKRSGIRYIEWGWETGQK